MKIRIADLNIELCHRYAYTAKYCAGYEAQFEKADLTVSTTNEEIERELENAPQGASPGYAEFICLHRAIAQSLPLFDAFVFHAAVVECDGRAYAFTAPSGTGKSTHVALWLQEFGARARVINGDKPIFRFLNGRLLAYGTPWCGKEGLGCNAASPLASLCFLERAETNRIARIDDSAVIARLFHQVFIPSTTEMAAKLLELLDRTVRTTPTYLLGCNISKEAAHVAFAGMNKGV